MDIDDLPSFSASETNLTPQTVSQTLEDRGACLSVASSSNTNTRTTVSQLTNSLPEHLKPLLNLFSSRAPQNHVFHYDLDQIALPLSRLLADLTKRRSSGRPAPPLPKYVVELQSRKSLQRRYFSFKNDPKNGIYAIMKKDSFEIYGRCEIRYHESHPCAYLESAVIQEKFLYEGYVYNTEYRPFGMCHKIKVERAIPVGRYEFLHEDYCCSAPLIIDVKCYGNYECGSSFPLRYLNAADGEEHYDYDR
jgi:hypothetical protein